MAYLETETGAKQLWSAIPTILAAGLKDAPRDFGALECLANDRFYAKPDSEKIFLLWEAQLGEGIKVETVPGGWKHHGWVYGLFMGPGFVRLPFNTWDSDVTASLSWATIASEHSENYEQRLLQLPRWSTASRSCLALIPENARTLDPIAHDQVNVWKRIPLDVPVPDTTMVVPKPAPHVPEWNARANRRFWTVIKDLGAAVAERGIGFGRDRTYDIGPSNPECRYRLYSLKTGVSYVGSMDEATTGGKHRLETNSSLAMARSRVIQSFSILDDTFGVQTEVLTITAPLGDGGRDGFQVRDLSAMKPGYAYMPGQAIPYARKAFDELDDALTEQQCEFWRRAFAVPLGRAKARLFLNFGLVHMSANAQNFLVGFMGKKVLQFLVRDIGDTSWHDEYLTRYFEGSGEFAKMAFDNYREELPMEHAHTLRKPETGNYPAPQIVRLGAYQTLSHDFGKVLQVNHHWNKAQLYRFAAGILEGFRHYVEAALFDGTALYPPAPPISLKDQLTNLTPDARAIKIGVEYDRLKSYGKAGKFPPYPDKVQPYIAKVKEAVNLTAPATFQMADAVRQLGESLEEGDFTVLGADAVDTLINAEELLMCAGLETRLGMAQGQQRDPRIAEKIQALLANPQSWPAVAPDAVVNKQGTS
jgi:hypothetical protein